MNLKIGKYVEKTTIAHDQLTASIVAEFEKLPIIAITAAAMKNDLLLASGLFNVYITKPVDFVYLTEVLKKYL